jgi:hypothetical protein
MKLCRTCGNTKPLAEFWSRRDRGPSAVQSKCKPCATMAGIPGRRKYAATAKGKAAARRHETGAGAASRAVRIERYKKEGRLSEYCRRKKLKRANFYREIHAAHEAVRRALISGALVRPDACHSCGSACKPDAHHHRGYSAVARLDVDWLCRKCHRSADTRGATGRLATWTGAGVGSEQ